MPPIRYKLVAEPLQNLGEVSHTDEADSSLARRVAKDFLSHRREPKEGIEVVITPNLFDENLLAGADYWYHTYSKREFIPV